MHSTRPFLTLHRAMLPFAARPILLALAFALAIPGDPLRAQPAPSAPPAPGATPASRNLLALATEAGTFKTLLNVIRTAGWTEKLEAEGPFTLFAPTDEAFAKLPAGTLETLLKPENKERLVQLLSYHVVPGRLTAAELARSPEVKTLLGDEVDIEADADGKATQVDESNLTTRDLVATNGILHVIDRVLQP